MDNEYVLLEIGDALELVDALNLTTSGDVNGLPGVLAVANVGTDDLDRLQKTISSVTIFATYIPKFSDLEHSEEDARVERCLSGETNGHERSASAEVVNRLLVGSPCCSCDYGRMGTETAGDGLDFGDDVLALLEVDPRLRAEFEAELLLLSTSVDSDWAQSTLLRVLDR